jgi:hypothetical protein
MCDRGFDHDTDAQHGFAWTTKATLIKSTGDKLRALIR